MTWKECLSNNAAWDTLTWFAALIGMASYLNKYGFIKWFSGKVCPRLLHAPLLRKALHRLAIMLGLLLQQHFRGSVRHMQSARRSGACIASA